MNKNKKMNPLLLVILVVIGLNILGFLLKLVAQFAGIAILVLIVYFLWQKFSGRGGNKPSNYNGPGESR